MYIHIERERDVYIHIYIYICVYVCVYMVLISHMFASREFTKGGLAKGSLAIHAFPLCNRIYYFNKLSTTTINNNNNNTTTTTR